ncbi:MAG: sulfotransferase family 2 domain-containing protein [Cyanobacteria bacterium P01_E01_bin.34]
MIKTLYRKYVLNDLPQFYLPSLPALNCSKALLFHHIPKNAGTSFRDILTRNYSRTERLYFYGNTDKIQSQFQSEKTSNTKARNIKCIATHKPKDWLEHLAPNYQAISFVRHPLNRVISLYNYLLTIPEERSGEGGYRITAAIREQKLSLEDIYNKFSKRSPQEDPEINLFSGFFNGQYRHLLGCYHNVRQVPYSSQIDLEKTSLFYELKSILDNHYYLGVVEEFKASVDKITEALNWKVNTYPHKLLGSRIDNTKLTPALRQKIIDYNQIDMLLWNLARHNILHEQSFNLSWHSSADYL